MMLSLMLSVLGVLTVRADLDEYFKSVHLMQNDIKLTREQRIMLQERGFYVAGKWPIKDGVPTVPYYIDESIPEGELRTNFARAAGVFHKFTCIKWVNVTKNYKGSKVHVVDNDGCGSGVGYHQNEDTVLSLAAGCEVVHIVFHEMMHAVGVQHTQCRPDRDAYVKIWPKNMIPGTEYNYAIETGSTLYDIPYDYLSVMHYKSLGNTINGSYSMTATDPYAMFVMGSHVYRWSDIAFVNKGNNCPAIFHKKCKKLDCKNAGYVGKDCSCKCPENTSGNLCENITGPFFSFVPPCSGIITKPQIISHGYTEGSFSHACVFKIEAPPCQKPQITILSMKLEESTPFSMIALEVSKTYFGYYFYDDTKVPYGQVFTSDGSKAAVYFYTDTKGLPQYGFNASITFTDGKC